MKRNDDTLSKTFMFIVRPRESWRWGRFVLDTRPPTTLGWGVQFFAPAVLVLAYALIIPLKLRGFLPPSVSWAGVIFIPSLMFLSACSPVIFPLRTPRQKGIMVIFMVVCCTVGTVAVYSQGWH